MYNILVCDDDRDIVEAIDIYLSKEGYNIIKAYDGVEAMDVLKKEDIQLLLIDVMMPKLDGMTATRLIRAMDRADARLIPIIAMTANAFEEDARKCIAAGMNVHMAKPLDLDEVIVVIARLCS